MPTVDCRLWTRGKMETAEYRLFEYIQSNLDYPYKFAGTRQNSPDNRGSG